MVLDEQKQQDFVRLKITDLAKQLGKHMATIYRAINFINENNWRPIKDVNVSKFRNRNKKRFNNITEELNIYTYQQLAIGWSPNIISSEIKRMTGRKISFKTIYRYIWQDKANGGKLYKLLSHHGKKYKYGSTKRSNIPNRTDISQRPKIVEQKIRIGDLEGDTIVGPMNGDTACLYHFL